LAEVTIALEARFGEDGETVAERVRISRPMSVAGVD
jgi:hypothetical protein